MLPKTAALVLFCLLTGCATLPSEVVRTPSLAFLPDSASPLVQMTAAAVPPGERSGLALLPVSSVAFETRLALAARASRSLDVQYYLLQADATGLSFMRALRDAAVRGVRVRVLVDDLYTAGEDPVLNGLAAYPNVEVRLFNPFVAGRGGLLSRLVFAAVDSDRINHRMHNKLFIADGTMAVTGGRNMADAYFMHSAGSNFVDVDLFMAGPAVQDLETIFDTYWNCDYAYPLRSIVPAPSDPGAARAVFSRQADSARGPPHEELSADFDAFAAVPRELARGRLDSLVLAHAEVFADPVDKAAGSKEASYEGTVSARVIGEMDKAQQVVSIVSPYFVPGDIGVEMMRQGKARGGRVLVLTNSLASTDEPAVHAGYAQYRRAMLEAGVELRELSPTLTRTRHRLGEFGKSDGSLHAKVVTIDGTLLYMGSMNLDPRSARENTEIGVFVQSEELVRQMTDLMDEPSLYHLRLEPNGALQWVAETDAGEAVFEEEPETGWWLRTESWLLSLIVPDNDI